MKNFRLQCLLRVLLLTATILGALLLFLQTTSYVAAGLLTVFAGIQGYALVRYIEKTNRDLARFLHSVRYSDFSQTFTRTGLGPSFDEVGAAISVVMDDFRSARAEKEENYRYLQTVMQHVGIGLLSFQQDGTVGLINNAAKRLLRVTHLKNIKALTPFSRDLVGTMLQLRSGEKALIKVMDNDELLELVIYATEFKMRGQLYTLVSIQDIQSELEEKEIEAWQKLTRVLTHEIMNSITPIASLASTVNELLPDLEGAGNGAAHAETVHDVRGAVRTIERRSKSLLHFVNAYRSLTRIPRPNLQIFALADLFENVTRLFQTQIEAQQVRFKAVIEPPGLDLTADPELIEQILINLIKNALESVRGLPDAEVTLSAQIGARGRTAVQVSDNGPGIVEEAMEKIFIPFFTTKKDGSGIGLSLSRQIMRQHGGTLSVFSDPDRQTVFTLRF